MPTLIRILYLALLPVLLFASLSNAEQNCSDRVDKVSEAFVDGFDARVKKLVEKHLYGHPHWYTCDKAFFDQTIATWREFDAKRRDLRTACGSDWTKEDEDEGSTPELYFLGQVQRSVLALQSIIGNCERGINIASEAKLVRKLEDSELVNKSWCAQGRRLNPRQEAITAEDLFGRWPRSLPEPKPEHFWTEPSLVNHPCMNNNDDEIKDLLAKLEENKKQHKHIIERLRKLQGKKPGKKGKKGKKHHKKGHKGSVKV